MLTTPYVGASLLGNEHTKAEVYCRLTGDYPVGTEGRDLHSSVCIVAKNIPIFYASMS